MQGVYENYLQQKMPDPNLNGIVEAAQWFCFSDTVQTQINHVQNYAVYPYLQYGFVVWHLLFASLAWPKITFPTKGYEVRRHYFIKMTTCKTCFRRSLNTKICFQVKGNAVLVRYEIEIINFIQKVLAAQVVTAAVQLPCVHLQSFKFNFIKFSFAKNPIACFFS